MPLGSSQGDRFEMLINIAVGGVSNLDKVASGAKLAAINMRDVDRVLKETGVSFEEQNINIERFRTRIEEFVEARTALKRAETEYAQSLQDTSVVSAEAIQMLAAKQQAVNELAERTQHLGEEINELAGERIVRLNEEVSKSTISQIRLGEVNELLTRKQKELGIQIRRAQRAQQDQDVTQERVRRSVDRTTDSLRQQNEEWGFLDQRVSRGTGAITIFRRSLGAIRNQILVVLFATRGLRRVLGEAFTAIRDSEAALRGVSLEGLNAGNTFQVTQQAAMDLTQRGLLTVSQASEGLQNLLARGLNLDEATRLMNVFTDAAAFNRRGHLELGEAVLSATEGFKLQNVRMIQNAGFTQRLSDIYERYSTQLGITTRELTDQQRTQAIFNAIMQEGALFAGDADRSLDVLQGRLVLLRKNTNDARLSLGEALNPAINDLISFTIRAQQGLRDFYEQYNPEITEAATLTIRVFTETLTLAGRTLQGIFNIMQTLFRGDASLFGTAVSWLLKYAVGIRLVNRVLGVKRTNLEALVNITRGYNINLQDQFRNQVLVNQENDKVVSGLDALKLRYAAARIEIAKLQVEKQKAIATSTGLDRVWKKLTATGFALTARFRAMWLAVGGLRGALHAAWVAFTRLMVIFVKVAVIIAVTTALVRLIQRVSEAQEAARRFNQEIDEMNEAVDRLGRRIIDVNRTIRQSIRRGIELNLETSELHKGIDEIEDRFNKIQELRSKFIQEEREQERQRLRERIDRHREALEAEIEQVTLARQRIQRIEDQFIDARQAVNERFFESQKEHHREMGLDSVLEAEKSFRDFLELQTEFNNHRARLTAQGRRVVEIEERRLQTTRIQLERRRNTELIELRQNFLDKLTQLNDQQQQAEISTIVDSMRRIREEFQLEQTRTIRDIDAFFKEQGELVNNLARVYQDAFNEASDSMILSIERFNNSAAVKQFLDFRDTKGPEGPALVRATVVAQEVEKLVKAFELGDISTRDFQRSVGRLRDRLADIRNEFVSTTLRGTDFEQRLNELDETIGGLVVSSANLSDTEVRHQQVMERTNRLMRELGDEYDELKDKILEIINLQRKQALSQEFLTLATRDLENQIRMLEIVEASRLQVQQIEDEIRLIDLERQRARVVGTLIGPMQQYVELRQRHQVEMERELMQMRQNMAQEQSQLTIIGEQIRAFNELLDGKAKVNGQTVELMEAQKNEIRVQLMLLGVEKAAVEANIAAWEELLERKRAAMDADFAEERIRAFVAGFQRITDSLVNLASGFAESLRDVRTEKQIYFDELAEELHHGEITQQQFMQETLAAQEFFNKKMEFERKKALADLTRTVGREIALFAARKAAQMGNIAAAVGLLVAGGAVAFLANNLASRIESEARRDFAAAERLFQRRVDEIRAEDTDLEDARRFGGTIRAEQLQVTISPTVVISGEQVFIGSGTISEFSNEVSDLILAITQQAIENRQIDLSSIRTLGG